MDINLLGGNKIMEIKKKNKFKEFFDKFGAYVGVGVLVLALTIAGIAIGLTAGPVNPEEGVDVSTTELKFSLPMSSPEVIKDFSATELQENSTLGHWEAHLSMDLASADGLVYSILDGTVVDVSYNYMEGNKITIQHADGFVSVYSSLGDEVLVTAGEVVKTGQKIGVVSTSATSESDIGEHLHFTLTKNNKKVDPNNYIEFQNK